MNELVLSKHKNIAATQVMAEKFLQVGSFENEAQYRQAMGDLMVLSAKDEKIKNYTPDSILKVIMMSVKTGLSLVTYPPQAYAYGYGNELSFNPDYRGLLKLIYDNSDVINITPQIVLEGDDFQFTESGIQYEMKQFNRKKMDNYKGIYYKVTQVVDGKVIEDFHFVGADEIETSKSASKGGSVWTKYYPDMAKKSGLKKIIKFLKVSSKVHEAFHYDSIEDAGTGHLNKDGQIVERKKVDVDVKDMEEVDLDKIETVDTIADAEKLVKEKGNGN